MKGWESAEVVWKSRRSMLSVSLKMEMNSAPMWDSLGACQCDVQRVLGEESTCNATWIAGLHRRIR